MKNSSINKGIVLRNEVERDNRPISSYSGGEDTQNLELSSPQRDQIIQIKLSLLFLLPLSEQYSIFSGEILEV